MARRDTAAQQTGSPTLSNSKTEAANLLAIQNTDAAKSLPGCSSPTHQQLDCVSDIITALKEVVVEDARNARMGEDVRVPLHDPVRGERPVRLQ